MIASPLPGRSSHSHGAPLDRDGARSQAGVVSIRDSMLAVASGLLVVALHVLVRCCSRADSSTLVASAERRRIAVLDWPGLGKSVTCSSFGSTTTYSSAACSTVVTVGELVRCCNLSGEAAALALSPVRLFDGSCLGSFARSPSLKLCCDPSLPIVMCPSAVALAGLVRCCSPSGGAAASPPLLMRSLISTWLGSAMGVDAVALSRSWLM